MTKKQSFDIAVLLPTRGRTTMLSESVMSLVDRTHSLEKVEFILCFDHDDAVGQKHFDEVLKPQLEEKNVIYTALSVSRLGYANLNKYYNIMAESATADWLFVWNDDARMETQDWDREIAKHTGKFKLLALHTHNDHPYSIFPIVPVEWYNCIGYIARHHMIDAEVSQNAYMLDIFERIPVHAVHDRHDLTGNNQDHTYEQRVAFEGNPQNPLDFHNVNYITARLSDCEKLSKYMVTQNLDITWWNNIKAGTQDPWDKLKLNDTNNQMKQFNIKLNRDQINYN